MNIEDKLKELITETGVTCIFDRWDRVNVDLDHSTFPVGIFTLPFSGTISTKNGLVTKSHVVRIYFADIIEYDATAERHADNIHQSMDRLVSFLALCDRYFMPVTSPVRYECLYDVTDVNITGVYVELTLTEKEKQCLKNPK